MPTFDIYGLASDALDDVRSAVEIALGIHFQSHESSYHGGLYYRYGELDEEHFILQKNQDLQENELAEPEFDEFAILVYVNHTQRSSDVRQFLEQSVDGIILLKHEVL